MKLINVVKNWLRPEAEAPSATLSRNALYNQWTREIIQRVVKPGLTSVDVGVHRGAVLKMILAAAPDAPVYGFEPIPDSFAFLQTRFVLPNVRLFNVALSDHEGEATFNYVVTNPGYSGLKKRAYDRPDEQDRQLQVRTGRMDDLVPADANVAFVKIDVEGAEYAVLCGGHETLRRNRPVVVFEHGLGGADVYGVQPGQVYDLLCGDIGLRISLLDDWLEGRNPLSRSGFERQFNEHLNYYFAAHPARA